MYVALAILLVATLFLVYASADISSGVYLDALCRIKTSRRCVALTFDDGPNPTTTPKILAVLRQYQIKAAFFCIGEQAEKYPEIVRQIVAEGHLVGNHTNTHRGSFPLWGKRRMQADIERCSQTLSRITHEPIGYFRPPFGVTNPTIWRVIRHLGLSTVGWSVRSYDTMSTPRSKVLRRIMRGVGNGAIILLHDRISGNELLLDELITTLRAENYSIERFDKIETI